MIGYLSGVVKSYHAPIAIVLTTSGVGYQVNTSVAVEENETIELYTSHIIRETDQWLFGFKNFSEKILFETLIEVNGVGPKTAFNMMNALGTEAIVNAIEFNQPEVLKSAPGIGKKGAEQIILSLKDKIEKIFRGTSIKNQLNLKTNLSSHLTSDVMRDSLEACQQLGFKESQVLPLLQALFKESKNWKTEDLIKNVLQELR